MKTTIDLPDALIQQAKQRALQQKRTLKDLIADYIRQGLKGTSLSAMSPRSSLVDTDATGLPLIRATCAPTVHTLPDALQLEQDLLQTHELTDLHSSDAGNAD